VTGLWQTVVSAADNSFPPFKAFELYGPGTWIGSGQPDMTPAALESSACIHLSYGAMSIRFNHLRRVNTQNGCTNVAQI
jgi:hypothetical protein